MHEPSNYDVTKWCQNCLLPYFSRKSTVHTQRAMLVCLYTCQHPQRLFPTTKEQPFIISRTKIPSLWHMFKLLYDIKIIIKFYTHYFLSFKYMKQIHDECTNLLHTLKILNTFSHTLFNHLYSMHLILNLSLNFMVTDFGWLILFPLKVMLTSFQSNSIMSQNIFLFYFTFLVINISIRLINIIKGVFRVVLRSIFFLSFFLSCHTNRISIVVYKSGLWGKCFCFWCGFCTRMGGLLVLFLSSCSFSSYCFCRSLPQSPFSSSSWLLVSFSSSSESDQSYLRGIKYSVGHHFLVGVHITKYSGDFWDCSDRVTIACVDTARTVVGCMNVTDAAVCWVGITTDTVGWVNMGSWHGSSTSLAWASQFCWNKSGIVTYIYFSWFWQYFYIAPYKHVSSLNWGGFRSFNE